VSESIGLDAYLHQKGSPSLGLDAYRYQKVSRDKSVWIPIEIKRYWCPWISKSLSTDLNAYSYQKQSL